MCAFKLLQFNIQYGQSWSDTNPDAAPIDLDGTIREIRRHNADVVTLQEVEQCQPHGAQPHPPANYSRLRDALPGYNSYFSYPKPDPQELPFGIGLAIFSRGPLSGLMRRDLPSPRVEFDFRGEKRTPADRLLIGAQTVLAGRTLQVFNTHLLAFFMINARGEDEMSQRQVVVDQLLTSAGPTLLAGDFNVVKHVGLVRQFAAVGFQTVQDAIPTWRRGPYVLDHVFYSRHLRPVGHAVTPTPASDHHTLEAEFEFAV